MTDYTHKRYLVENARTGKMRTATAPISRRGPLLRWEERVVAVIGGYKTEKQNYGRRPMP